MPVAYVIRFNCFDKPCTLLPTRHGANRVAERNFPLFVYVTAAKIAAVKHRREHFAVRLKKAILGNSSCNTAYVAIYFKTIETSVILNYSVIET